MAGNKKITLQQSWPWWRFVLLGLNVMALVMSAVLSWHYLQNDVIAGCGSGSSCDEVLNSRWSEIAGILPVSGLALGAYFALLVAGLFIGPKSEMSVRHLAWRAMLVLAGSVAGSAIWFTILQKWIIGAFCPYCMSLHITGLILATLIIRQSISKIDYELLNKATKHAKDRNDVTAEPERLVRPLQAVGFVITGLVLAGILASFQFGYTSSSTYSNGESKERIHAIDYRNAPMVGSSNAPYIVNVLFDYQCSHCQKIHFMLNEATNRYKGKLAFALCPAPLNSDCNPYIPQSNDVFKNSCELARIALAVWIAKRDVFSDFENWMFTFESGDRWNPRSLHTARVKAIEFVGQKQFDAAWSDPWIDQYIQTCTGIYSQTIQNGKGGVPKLIYGSRWIIPEAFNADDFVMMLQKSLDVPKP